MKSLPAAEMYPFKQKLKSSGVKLVRPTGNGFQDLSSEGDLVSNDDIVYGESDTSDSGGDPLPPGPPLAMPDADDAADAADAAERNRHRRVLNFGPWTISEYHPGGVFSGYGANCHRHHNSWQPGAACKRVFTFKGCSPDHTRCLAKQWLLMGCRIRSHWHDSKKRHLQDICREDIPLRAEAELDREAAAML